MKEDKLQFDLCRWLDSQNVKYFHVPNGGLRSKREAARFAGMGVKSGIPDLVLLMPDGHVIFIELKVTGNYLQRTQKIWRYILKKLGFEYHLLIAGSSDSGIQALKSILHRYALPLEKIALPAEL